MQTACVIYMDQALSVPFPLETAFAATAPYAMVSSQIAKLWTVPVHPPPKTIWHFQSPEERGQRRWKPLLLLELSLLTMMCNMKDTTRIPNSINK